MTKQTFSSFEGLKSLLPEEKVAEFEKQKQANAAKKVQIATAPVKKKKPFKKTKRITQQPKKPIDPKLQAIFDALSWLKQTFPKAFLSPPAKILPLKVGIGHDIAAYLKEKNAEQFSLTLLRKALSMYTKNFRYLTASAKIGNIRIDLEGNQAGEVSEEQAKYAQEKLTELKEKRKQKEAENANDSSQSK